MVAQLEERQEQELQTMADRYEEQQVITTTTRLNTKHTQTQFCDDEPSLDVVDSCSGGFEILKPNSAPLIRLDSLMWDLESRSSE